MRVIPSADYRRMPWKNGGGETIEIAVSPPGASLDNFEWRISMAKVAASGPFSVFPGIDRTLSVLSGDGIVLKIAGRDDVRLDRGSPPYSFPADLACEGVLIGGEIEDLNVMVRRNHLLHRVRRLRLAGRTSVAITGDTALVVARATGATIEADGDRLALAAGDSAAIDSTGLTTVDIAPATAGDFYVIELWRPSAAAEP